MKFNLNRRNGESVEVSLEVLPGRLRSTGKIYYLYDPKDNKVGLMSTYVSCYIDPNTKVDDQHGKWLEIESLCNYTNDDGPNKIIGIGTLLIKKAFEDSYHQECEGRIHLDATGDSHFFYFSLGFCPHPDYNLVYRPYADCELYDKIKSQHQLTLEDTNSYKFLQEIACKETMKPIDQISINEIFFIDITKTMTNLYNEAKQKENMLLSVKVQFQCTYRLI
jgi:hypothetical protein